MLPGSHDAEDAFQATFVVLARRAGSIGRRERLASWLYGVAVRTAKEARRRSARVRSVEARLMDLARLESESTGDRDDLIELVDEELSRLPSRYRSALVACELEGKSRRQAAGELGIPEGTLSTYLARGRKLLRERLRRRGFNPGVGAIAGMMRPLVESTVPERLMEPTVRVALAASSGATATVPSAVSSLAERVLKMMLVARLTLIVAVLIAAAAGVASAMMLAFVPAAATPQAPAPPAAGPDGFAGRVVDKTGAGVADVQVWAIRGPHWARLGTKARVTSDSQGRFVVPWPQNRDGVLDPWRLLRVRSQPGRSARLAGSAREPHWGRDRAHAGRRRPRPADRPGW